MQRRRAGGRGAIALARLAEGEGDIAAAGPGAGGWWLCAPQPGQVPEPYTGLVAVLPGDRRQADPGRCRQGLR